MIRLYADGLCEPKNPGGWACWGWVALDDRGCIVASGRGTLGRGRRMSNNLAEYEAAIQALTWAVQKRLRGIVLHVDSQLIANQVAGLWGCYADHLRPLRDKVRHLLAAVDGRIQWVPRERNQLADAESRRAYKEVQRYGMYRSTT